MLSFLCSLLSGLIVKSSTPINFGCSYVPPEISIISTPALSNIFATIIESSAANPPFWKSAEFIFTEIGKSSPTSSLDLLIISKWILALFSISPPHASFLLLISGERNSDNR